MRPAWIIINPRADHIALLLFVVKLLAFCWENCYHSHGGWIQGNLVEQNNSQLPLLLLAHQSVSIGLSVAFAPMWCVHSQSWRYRWHTTTAHKPVPMQSIPPGGHLPICRWQWTPPLTTNLHFSRFYYREHGGGLASCGQGHKNRQDTHSAQWRHRRAPALLCQTAWRYQRPFCAPLGSHACQW